VPKQNGPSRTDFPRFRKVVLAKAKALDFSSSGNYESDYWLFDKLDLRKGDAGGVCPCGWVLVAWRE
jgi:hypothetical protein